MRQTAIARGTRMLQSYELSRVSVERGPDGGGWRSRMKKIVDDNMRMENPDDKMLLIKCGWKNSNGNMRMETFKCG